MGRRALKSPAMIARDEPLIASMRLSTRRATNSAPRPASTAKKISDVASARTITAPMRARSCRSWPTNRRKPLGNTNTRASASRPGAALSSVA